MKPILEVKQLEKSYRTKFTTTKVLKGISFDILPGEFVSIMGPSGAGKSTLLNCLATIDRPDHGEILLGEKSLGKAKEKELAKIRNQELGFIFQEFNLLDNMTNEENIALALQIQKQNPKYIKKEVQDLAEILGITKILPRFPFEISGGQQQRVAAARAMITKPKLILADEPTGSLDSKSAHDLLNYLQKLNQELEATILMVTHDVFTASYSQRILFIKDGELFTQIHREEGESRSEFVNRIIQINRTLEGGNLDD